MSENVKKKYLDALEEITLEFSRRDPIEMSQRSKATYNAMLGLFILEFCGKSYEVYHPEGRVVEANSNLEANITDKILFLNYLCNASGLPLRNRWMSYHEFPGGINHFGTFKIEAIQPLARYFGDNPQLLIECGIKLGGKSINMGDAAVVIDALPMVPVAVVLWGSDEEFPASANIIFDASANTYLPTGVLDYLGEAVSKRLMQAANMGY